MTAATTTQLLKAAIQHKLTSAEWAVLAILLYSEHEIEWAEILRTPSPLTDGGLRKGLNSLHARGWVEILHGHAKQHGKIVLLPIIIHADKGDR